MDKEYDSIIKRYMAMFSRIHSVTQNVDATIAILQEVAKDWRINRFEARKQHAAKQATPKQLALLEELGVECDPKIASKEASRLIDEALQNRTKQS